MKKNFITKEPCLICSGKGKQQDKQPCPYCEGTGLVAVRAKGNADIVQRILGKAVLRSNAKTRREHENEERK